MAWEKLCSIFPWRKRRKINKNEDLEAEEEEIELRRSDDEIGVDPTSPSDPRTNYYTISRTGSSRRPSAKARGLAFLSQVMSSEEFQEGNSMCINFLKHIYQCNMSVMAKYLENCSPEEIKDARIGGQSLLHILCFKKDIDCLRLLLSHSVDPNETNDDGVTALHLAVNEEWTEGVEELLSHGASANTLPLSLPNSNWPYQELPVLTAARNGSFDIASLLLKQISNFRVTDADKNTILHLACYSHCAELVFILMILMYENDYTLNEMFPLNNKGNTPLHSLMSGENIATFQDEILQCIDLLIENGADINQKNLLHKTPIYLAARANLPMVVKSLLVAGADPTVITRDGRSVLHAACHSGSHESLSFLLQSKRTLNLILREDHNGYAPFHIAVSSCSLNCCELLIKHGDHLTRLDSKNRSRCSLVLHNMPSAQLLLKRIFDSYIQVSDEDPESPQFHIKMNYSVLLSRSSEDVEASIISDISGSNYQLLLKHPLIESFLYHKWNRIRWFFYTYVMLFFLFLIIHTFYVVKTFGMGSDWANEQNILMMVHIAHIVMVLVLLIPGTITLVANIKKYLQQWETYFKTIALATAAYVVFARDSRIRNREVESNVAAVSIFFTWVEFMMLLGRFPSLGVYILMFTRVAKSIITFLLAFSSLLIAFTLSFGILLSNINVFKTFPIAFVKTLMMMLGEIDYTDIYEQTKDGSTAKLVISQIFMVVFLFLIPVLMANLLIGLAVNDLPDLQYHGKIRRLLKEASYLEAYERLLLVFKEWTCIPNSLIGLCSNRGAIRREITIYPNKHSKYRVKSSHVPTEAIKAAIALGAKQKKEGEDVETLFKNFLQEYRTDRGRLEAALEVLIDGINTTTGSEQSEDVVDSRFKLKSKLKTVLRRKGKSPDNR